MTRERRGQIQFDLVGAKGFSRTALDPVTTTASHEHDLGRAIAPRLHSFGTTAGSQISFLIERPEGGLRRTKSPVATVRAVEVEWFASRRGDLNLLKKYAL